MIHNDVVFGATATEIVPLNKIELAARLGKGVDINSDIVNTFVEQYNQKANKRYSYVKLSCKCANDICCFEEILVKSSTLAKVLEESNEVIFLAVSSGIEVDQLINKCTIQNSPSAFYIDAIASAGIESYIEYISNQICAGLNGTKRFSPGYADFPLEFQSYLLERLSAKETLGIMLSKDYLMIPTKSITAVIGIK